jgi:plastocyanin
VTRRFLVTLALAVLPAGALAAEHTVVIDNFQFKPQTLRVRAGDAVEWVNKDIVEHTATAANNAFDSRTIRPERKWRWVAGQKGQYAYICAFHPNMKGVVEVE